MQRQFNEQIERPNVIPVQNMFAYREVANHLLVATNQIAANSFELKPGLINMVEVNAFGSRNIEDDNKHLTKFIQISKTVKANGMKDEQVRLRLFSFSLKDDANDWYDSISSNSVRTWDAMVELFLEKYYPLNEALKRQAEVIQFMMKPHETIREARGRLKSLMKRCSNHGLNMWQQVVTFYGEHSRSNA